MNENQPETGSKKAKYIVSIIYLLVLAFIVGGSYINQQDTQDNKNTIAPIINQSSSDL